MSHADTETQDDPARCAAMTAHLHATMPIYGSIGFKVVSLSPEIRCELPLGRHNTNHFGVMHAGALFTFAEAVGGLMTNRHRAFRAHHFLARGADVRYLAPARTTVHARGDLPITLVEQAARDLELCCKANFDLPITVFDDAEIIVMEAHCRFQLTVVA